MSNDEKWKPALQFAGDWSLDWPASLEDFALVQWCDTGGPHDVQVPAWVLRNIIDRVDVK